MASKVRKSINYNFLDSAKNMPPMFHNKPGQEFNINNSDVANWLVSQPEIKQKIFNMANYKKVIVFNPDTGKWQGVEYEN